METIRPARPGAFHPTRSMAFAPPRPPSATRKAPPSLRIAAAAAPIARRAEASVSSRGEGVSESESDNSDNAPPGSDAGSEGAPRPSTPERASAPDAKKKRKKSTRRAKSKASSTPPTTPGRASTKSSPNPRKQKSAKTSASATSARLSERAKSTAGSYVYRPGAAPEYVAPRRGARAASHRTSGPSDSGSDSTSDDSTTTTTREQPRRQPRSRPADAAAAASIAATAAAIIAKDAAAKAARAAAGVGSGSGSSKSSGTSTTERPPWTGAPTRSPSVGGGTLRRPPRGAGIAVAPRSSTPLDLGVVGDASEEQRALTAARKAAEAEAAERRAAAARSRAAARNAERRVARAAAVSAASGAAPPPHLEAVIRETVDGDWDPKRAKGWAKFTPGQLRCELEEAKILNRRKNSAAFSAALRERRETAHRLRPKMAYGNLHPLNVAEEKARFLREWEAYERGRRATRPDDPRFEYADPEAARLQMKEYGAPRDHLLAHAERIMSLKRGRFGSDGSYERAAWGDRVDVGGLEATVRRYLEHLGVEHRVEIEWHDALATPSMTTKVEGRGARGVLHLPRDAAAHPKHFREAWVEALLDHEIGTHFVCAHNDAAVGEHVRGTFAPGGGRSVATTRRNVTPREHLVTEEGLATINTHMAARVKLLWGPALAYWTRWMGSRMGFSELFEALAPHVPSPAARWTQCYRCKRGLVDTSEKRALAKDQCYLEGAWRLLEGRKLIDFRLLHSGRISMEEYAAAKSAWLKFSQSRVRDKCETVTPHFLKTEEAYATYERRLEEIAEANGVPARDDQEMRTLTGWPPRRGAARAAAANKEEGREGEGSASTTSTPDKGAGLKSPTSAATGGCTVT